MSLLAFTASAATAAYPQNIYWKARYDGPPSGIDAAYSNAVDSQDNVVVTGTSQSATRGLDFLTIKYGKGGAPLWVRRFDGETRDDVALTVAVDSLDNVIVAGKTTTYGGNTNYMVLKYDAVGNLLWMRTHDGAGSSSDNLTGLAVDSAGNVYVTGESRGLTTSVDYDTVKYAPDGTFQWSRRYDHEAADDQAVGLAVDPSGNVIVTGRSYGSASEFDWATIKYGPSGGLKWVRRLSGLHNLVGNDRPNGLVVDSTGRVTVYGMADHGLSDTSDDWLVARYDQNGVLQWRWSMDGPKNGNDECRAGVVLANGEFVGSGTVANETSGSDNLDIWTVKLNTLGKKVWSKVYKGLAAKDDVPRAAAVDANSNTIVTGYTYNTATYPDFITLKYDADGNRLWARRFGADARYEIALDVSLDSLGDPIVSGAATGATSFDFLTIKYKP